MPGLERKIQPEELVNEAYLKLQQYLDSREDVSFRISSTVLRNGPGKSCGTCCSNLAKKGGESTLRTTLMLAVAAAEAVPDRTSIDAFAFYRALEPLHVKNGQQAVAVELHYIAGWTLQQSAELMGLSTATLKRQLSGGAAVVCISAAFE